MRTDTDDESVGRNPSADVGRDLRCGWIAVVAAAVILAADQATKLWVAANLPRNTGRIVIDGFFDLVHYHNTGAAFGMLRGRNGLLVAASIITLVLLWIYRRSLHGGRWWRAMALGGVMGGILGNFVDRVRVAGVIDFLDFHVGGRHWPAFNIADAAICVGIFVAMVVSLLGADETAAAAPGTDGDSELAAHVDPVD